MQNTTTSSTYRGYTINTGKDNNLPCNTKTLDQLTDSIEHMGGIDVDTLLARCERTGSPFEKLSISPIN